MTRQHLSAFYSSEGMRQLQAQIDELWEAMQLDHPFMPIGPDNLQMMQEVMAEEERQRVNHDANNAVTVAEVAAELQPDPFQITSLGYGWYKVLDGEGRQIHDNKLRKEPAQEAWQAAMEGV